jgi:hypothetical protein
MPQSVGSWWERLTAWAETGARLLVAYWLLLVGCSLVFGSAILKWVQFPFSSNLSGMQVSLLRDPGITAQVSLFSVAVLGVIVLGIGLLFLKKSPALLGPFAYPFENLAAQAQLGRAGI